MKEYIEEIEQNIKNIRSAIENQGVDIPENTPLDEYADKIAEIERPTVKIGHDILPFYCYADNEIDASNKSKPTIEWNSEKATWDITEYNDGWTQSIPNDNPNMLLYAMFVPIKEGQNSSDDTFAWPKAIRLQGKKGEKGEEGNDGRDGVIAGMIQYLAAHLFKIVSRNDVTNELTNTPVLEYNYTQISNDANRHPKPNFLRIKNASDEFEYIPEKSTSSNNTWGLNYELPLTNPEDYAVLKCVASYNSVNNRVIVSDPIQLSGEGVVLWTEWYYVSDTMDAPDTSPSIENGWSKNQIPDSFYEYSGLFYLWNRTQVNYDSGREILTDPILIMSSPKSINNIECLYGHSISIQTQPTVWYNDIPDDFIVLWKQETTNFTVGESKTIITPIAVKGNPGVDLLGNIRLEDIDSWTNDNMSGLDFEEYYFRKGIVVGKDIYIWSGSQRPTWINQEDCYETVNGQFWIIIKDPFTTNIYSDWNAQNSEIPGYIANRTHYVETITGTFGNGIDGDLPDNAINIKIWSTSSSWEYKLPTEINNDSKLRPFKWTGGKIITILSDFILNYSYEIVHRLDSKFVSPMTELTYSELKLLRDNSQLIPGMQYRIIDYVTMVSKENTISAGHPFDIIVTADSESILNEKARAIQHEGDKYFIDCDLNAWELKYCLDNDIEKFEWADEVNGKGVIYRMIDEFNNECPYDFKNIQFKHPIDTTTYPSYYYTFSYMQRNGVHDDSLRSRCYNNVIKERLSSNSNMIMLNNIVFINPTAATYECCNNYFDVNCYNNSFGKYCCGNTFKQNCYDNSFGENCSYNYFGDSCYHNSFGDSCYNNSFGSNCQYNSFGDSCTDNTFGNSCTYNTFGLIDQPKSRYRKIIFDNGNRYINLNCTATMGSSDYYQNIRIGLGVNNGKLHKTIDDSNINQTYETVYRSTGSKLIEV